MKAFILFLSVLSISALLANNSENVEYEEDIQLAETECLQIMGMNRGFGSSYQIKFYNSCPKSIWASICVEERPGKFKLHESNTRVPKYGYMTVYTHEGTAPISVNWVSGMEKPSTPPGQCGIHSMRSDELENKKDDSFS